MLVASGYAIVDGFLGAAAACALLENVRRLQSSDASPFVLGRTGGGKDGKSTKYAESVVRGDSIAVLGEGEEGKVPGLQALLRQADELVAGMASSTVPELRRVVSRSRPMLACYPGGGARYVRHLDNPGGPGRNGRLLTLLLYLNAEWQPNDGGMLRVHTAGDGDGGSAPHHVDIEPLLDRAVCFWSDHRTPHEVLPAQKPRWAVSVWYHQHEKAVEMENGPAAAEPAAGAGPAGAPVATPAAQAAVADDGSGTTGVSEVSFGNTTEEIEGFLLALMAMKGGNPADRKEAPKAKHYSENLRSW